MRSLSFWKRFCILGFCWVGGGIQTSLFKKLQKDIWEFRTKYGGQQIRLLAFWDKTKSKETLVFATHGFIKKVDKVPSNEIERAVNIRKRYFENSLKK